jgi:hypothetical protein
VHLEDVKARIGRLDKLVMSILRHLYVMEKCEDPLLYVERREYLGALQRGVGGLESARVVLVMARARLEGN